MACNLEPITTETKQLTSFVCKNDVVHILCNWAIQQIEGSGTISRQGLGFNPRPCKELDASFSKSMEAKQLTCVASTLVIMQGGLAVVIDIYRSETVDILCNDVDHSIRAAK